MTPLISPGKFDRKVLAVTLVEILVSVGIISIVAALSFPTLRGFLAKGKETRCLSSHRAIIQAVLTYAADYGCLPGNRISGGNDGAELTAYKLSPYLNVAWRFDRAWKSQWFCPSRADGFDQTQFPNYAFSREVFGLGSSPYDGTSGIPPVKMSAITHLSKTAAISCVVGHYAIYSVYAFAHAADPPVADMSLGQLAAWHSGHAIITFMDGHTQVVEPYPKSDPRRFWFSLNNPNAP